MKIGQYLDMDKSIVSPFLTHGV